jgi:hypothetical protein
MIATVAPFNCRSEDVRVEAVGTVRSHHGFDGQLPDGQISQQLSELAVQPPSQKYFCFSETQIKLYE